MLLVLTVSAAACSSEGDDVMQSGDTWEMRGALLAWDGEIWVVDDQPLVVPASLSVDDQRVLGATVDARGSIDDAGRRVVETIDISDGEWPDTPLPAATIEGTIDQVNESSWMIDDDEVIVPAGVRVHGVSDLANIANGDAIKVEGYRLDDGRVVAVDVSVVEQPAAEGEAVAPAGDPTEPAQSTQTVEPARPAETPYDPAVVPTPAQGNEDEAVTVDEAPLEAENAPTNTDDGSNSGSVPEDVEDGNGNSGHGNGNGNGDDKHAKPDKLDRDDQREDKDKKEKDRD